MTEKILAINPGSTSTKIAVYQDGQILFKSNVSHSAAELAGYPEIADQMPCRKQASLDALAQTSRPPAPGRRAAALRRRCL